MKRTLAILTVTFFSIQARAERWVDMQMDGWATNCSSEVEGEIFRQASPSTSFPLELGGDYQCPWITASTKYAGSKAMALWLKPTGMRSEVNAAHSTHPHALRNGLVRYFGFAMQINNSSSDWPLDEDVHFMQAWQAYAPCGVPLVGTLINNSWPLRFRFRAKFDEYSGGELMCGSQTIVEAPLSIGPWHTFVVKLAPNNAGTAGVGNITVWHNNVEIVNWNHDWGSIPEAGHAQQWDIRAGAYRPSGGDQNLVMIFDNIRVASTKAEATP